MTSSDQFGSSRTSKAYGPNSNCNANTTVATNTLNKATNSKSQTFTKPPECFGCHKPILERFLLKALDQVWHEDCLKCSCCNCRLGEIGSTLFTKANLILCKRDYLRMFGTTGFCSSCSKQIPAFEMVMRARGNVYHLECFKCEACSHRFCVGDRFYLHDNKILCEYDYEEQMTMSHIQQQHQQFYHSLVGAESGAKSSSHECQAESECIKVGKNYPLNITAPPSLGPGQY